jgi:ribosomal protein S18 acetylase RimI-like enzyme
MVPIKSATKEDISTLAALHVASKQIGYAPFCSDDYINGLNTADYKKNWVKWLESGSNVLLAFDEDNNALGFISFGGIQTRLKEDRGIMPSWPGEIYALYVHPDHWGKGVAQSLMRAATEPMRKNYWDKALLWVIDKNKRAISFYEQMGGQRVGKQKSDIGEQEMTEIAFGWKDISKIK